MELLLIILFVLYISIAIYMELKEDRMNELKKSITNELLKLNNLSNTIENLYQKRYSYNDDIIKDELLKIASEIDNKLIQSNIYSPDRLSKLKLHHKFLCGRMAEYAKLVSISSIVSMACNNSTSSHLEIDKKYKEAQNAMVSLKQVYLDTLSKNVDKIVLDILDNKDYVTKLKNEITQICKLSKQKLDIGDLKTSKRIKDLSDKRIKDFVSMMDYIITFRNKMHNIIFEIRCKESELRLEFNKLTELMDEFVVNEYNWKRYNSLELEKSNYFNSVTFSGDYIKMDNQLTTLIKDIQLLNTDISNSVGVLESEYDRIFNDVFSEYGEI